MYPNSSKLIFRFFLNINFCLLNKKDWFLKVFLVAFSKTTACHEFCRPIGKEAFIGTTNCSARSGISLAGYFLLATETWIFSFF